MTFQQLRLALEAARTGSISRAAKSLYLSQPSASGMLRTLEQELGYAVFLRTNGGIAPTAEGLKFLEHAKKALNETEQIYAIRNQGRKICLRLGAQNFSRAVNAFVALTEEYRDYPNAEFRCTNISVNEGIRALYNLNLDVLAALIAPDMIHTAEQEIKKYGLELHTLYKIPVMLNLRKGHPLLEKLPPYTESFDYTLLAQYPYVEYQKIPVRADSYTIIKTANRVGYRYCITVDERDTRCRIVSMTDAFSVGCSLPEDIRERYELECVPIPGEYMQLFCVMRRGGLQNEEISRYLQLLEQQFDTETGGKFL